MIQSKFYDIWGAWGSLFSSTTQKTPEPVTATKADNTRWTGTKNARRCGDIARGAASQYAELWCPSTLLHSARAHGRVQDREPVERPFHDLWTDGGETEKRPPCPQRLTESVRIMDATSEMLHLP